MRADGPRVRAALAATLTFSASGLRAQAPARPPSPGPEVPLAVDLGGEALTTLGSVAAERLRVAQLVGGAGTAGYLLRTPSLLTAALAPRPAEMLRVTPIRPELVSAINSRIAVPGNDGALWAGRGASVLVRGGVLARSGRLTVLLVPEVMWAQNRGYQSTPSGLLGQFPASGPYAAPWFTGAYSADLPIRFGDQPYATVGPGQSALYVTSGSVATGFSTENQWWGPGTRNALLLSDAAEGVPHLFLRTARPLRTRVGDVEARWIFGGLTASLYHPSAPGRERGRAISGAVATLRLRADTGLTLGVARLVLSPARDPGQALGRAFDVFTRNASLGGGDTLAIPLRVDQLASLFARWVVPGAGAEVYGEFARLELPRSLRDFLLAPMNTGAYTLGFANAWRPRAGHAARVALEVTNLEQTRTFEGRPRPPDFYTGRAVPGGFTNRGQVLGASIGPGSQSQWIAADYYARRWQAGVYAERVRHQNDALYRQFLSNFRRHDVSFGGGVRAGYRAPYADTRATLGLSRRINYLFQSGAANYFGVGTADVTNVALTLTVSPPARVGRP